MTLRTFPLGVMEALALEAGTRGHGHLYPRTSAVLEADGLMKDGTPTPAGVAKLAEHRQAKEDDAIERNVLVNVNAEMIVTLGRLDRGEEVGDVGDLRRTGLVDRGRDGVWRLTTAGRKAYSLAAGRTY